MTTEITTPPAAPQQQMIPKKKSKKQGWRYRTPPNLTLAQETVFLNMQIRKLNRALSGTKSRNTTYEFVALAVLLVITYSVGAQSRNEDLAANSELFVTLTIGQVITIGVWLYVAAFVTATFSASRFIELLRWMFVYLPLLAMIISFVFDTKAKANEELSYLDYGAVIGIIFAIAEILAVTIFVGIFYFYPKHINSKSFRSRRRASRFWQIKVITDWTMTYVSKKPLPNGRHTCKYQGETNKDGLPHGLGRWFDDSEEGEILTGTWKDGLPVAPFFSRHYGRGDLFSAVRIAYVMASDDTWDSTNFWPSNAKPARCGISTVECSVSGHFYNELPHASPLMEETPFDQNTSAEALCRELRHIGTEDQAKNIVFINANDPRGVQIKGCIHSNTGKTFNKVDEILVKVQPATQLPNRQSSSSMEYMPFSRRSIEDEMIAIREDNSDAINEDTDEVDQSIAVVPQPESVEHNGKMEEGTTSSTPPRVTLTVENWIPSKHKEALIFLAGFKCSLRDALQGFGQFIAMTKLDSQVYPILYGWPCGALLSYHSASRTSYREQNKENFLSLLRSLQQAGIRDIHLMSHSMGAQTLVGAFCDKEDGSRSDVSLCFKVAPRSESGTTSNQDISELSLHDDEDDSLLTCKTLTMLNPDFPVDPFVNHAFRSIRRICDTVTVVGDRTDQALFWSQLVNGLGVYCGYKQPRELQPNDRNTKHLRFQHVIGRNIEKLYLPETKANDSKNDGILFSERAPLRLVSEREDVERQWLDLDVIDTSGLDTNIANIRHSAFNLNPILLNDLEELIRTNHRAIKRTSLLYRDGNIFSYCHAPSYVSY